MDFLQLLEANLKSDQRSKENFNIFHDRQMGQARRDVFGDWEVLSQLGGEQTNP